MCTGTGTGAHVSARVGACAGWCKGVRVSARAGTCAGRRVEVAGDLVESCGMKLGDNVRLPAHQCHGDGRWRSRGDGSRNGSGDRRDVFPQGQFKLVPKRLMFLRLRLGVFLRKLEDLGQTIVMWHGVRLGRASWR